MKNIVFDTGPIITLTMNNLLWILKSLKEKGNVNFYITDSVKKELVDNPLNRTMRYKFEALQVLKYIEEGILEVVDNNEISAQSQKLLSLANNCFNAFGNNMNIVHEAEMSAIALYLQKKADALVVDEKTTRLLIENSKKLHIIINHNLHTKVEIDKDNLKEILKITKNVKIIRSVELAAIAYEKGFLDGYLAHIDNPREILLESVLWGFKLNGCAVTRREIEQMVRTEIA